jgi:hypothetical protein
VGRLLYLDDRRRLRSRHPPRHGDWQVSRGFEPRAFSRPRSGRADRRIPRGARQPRHAPRLGPRGRASRSSMPTGMVEFARYEAPFAHYDSKDGSGVRVLLISQSGDQRTLFGLYDIMQTLEIVPLEGQRERRAHVVHDHGRERRLRLDDLCRSGRRRGQGLHPGLAHGRREASHARAPDDAAELHADGRSAARPAPWPTARADLLSGLSPSASPSACGAASSSAATARWSQAPTRSKAAGA